MDGIEDILKVKLSEVDIDKNYIIDFIEDDILSFDKVRFIHKYGSVKAKASLVDYKLRT